jgi:hypothetical protein
MTGTDDEDEDGDADFESGFAAGSKPVAPQQGQIPPVEAKPAPEKPPEPPAGGQPASGAVKPPAAAKTPPSPAASPAASPKPAKPASGPLSPDEIARLRALEQKVPEQDRQLSKAFGTIGELQQQLKTLRGDAKPAPVEPQPRLTGEALIIKRLQEQAMIDLEEDYPDWRDLVGAPKANETPDPEHPFRKWLASKDAAYQTKINTSNSARAIARAIDLFKAETAKPPPKGPQPAMKAKAVDGVKAARRDRIANAVPPRTTAGNTAIRARTPDDDFDEGFAQG